MTVCAHCGEEIPEDEIMLGKKKVPRTDLYEVLCIVCFEKEGK